MTAKKAAPEPAATKEKDSKEQGKEPKSISMRPLTETELAILEQDDVPPAGYSNTKLGETLEDAATGMDAAPEADAKEPAAEAEKAQEKGNEPQQVSEDAFVRLERELAKPEGKEDTSKFSKSEKAYFHQMRRDRKARQRAEEERDQALFREKKIREEAAKKAEPEKDIFDGKADDDILTVADAKALLKNQPKTDSKPAETEASNFATQKKYLLLCEKEARSSHSDFDAVMELSDELIATDPQALKELSEKTQAGENPAEVMYGLIKQHKDFENLFPAAEIRSKARSENAAKKDSPASPPSANAATPTPEDKAKEDKAKQTEKALEENVNRTKTTAHVSSREGKPAEELTLEEIASMSDMAFAKLPRNVRQRYLKQYGG